MPEHIYELSITLRDSNPPISRVVAVPSGIHLGQLHEIVQTAMGWTNSHLHQFIAGTLPDNERTFVSVVTPFGDETELEGEDELGVTLAEVCPNVGSLMLYVYDFGDDWEHLLEVKKTTEAGPKAAGPPTCLAGENACPPEDCGGVPGYEELLQALDDPRHEMHEEMTEWVGKAFDPKAFDLDAVNAALAKQWKAKSRARQPRRRAR